MSGKSRKSITPWVTCEKCMSIISQKDIGIHELECPLSDDERSHNHIRKHILYSKIEIYSPKELPKHLTEVIAQDYIFMSDSSMELCEIAIGSYVMIKFKDHTIIKEAFRTTEKSLTSVSLTAKAMKIYNINNGDRVQVQSFNFKLLRPKEIFIQYVGKKMPRNLRGQIESRKHLAIGQVFCIGNRVSFPFYGQDVKLKMIEIIGDNEDELDIKNIEGELGKMSLNDEILKFYKPDFSTKWTFVNDEIEVKNRKEIITIQDIGGYHELLNKLRAEFDIIFGKYEKFLETFKTTKVLFIYGTIGVGKTTISNALLSQYDVNVFALKPGDICNQSHGEGDKKLCEIFNDAKSQAPSAILFEDIDELCGKKSASESERRLITTLVNEIDCLHNSGIKCLLLATSSKPDAIHPALRRLGRIENEFEICAPTPQMRREILEKMLMKLPNVINSDDLHHISFTTHGFVAADLYRLCSQAAKCAIKRYEESNAENKILSDIKVTNIDFNNALKIITPFTMKEVLVEVPNVKWTEIGGQESLKLKLQQAVEWPLKYPESFTKLGIRPPRGVLMFGPPGCSKTMIARALATESKLNFINIKGPELFSMWVGESERAVREVFRKARQVAPSIVFIDEIDALGGERASGNAASGGNNVQERVLTQLLTELDGVTALGAVTLVAATNRPDRIDKALLRPGRLDRIIYVPLPDAKTRQEIFEIQFRNMPVDDDVNICDLVEVTEGYSGAEVQAICHEAAMKALEVDITAEKVTRMHFTSALKIVSPRTPASLVKLYEDYKNNR